METWDAKAPHHAETHWILDVAHNPAGAWALRAALRSEFGLDPPEENAAVLLFSCLRDKPLTEMAQILFPLFDEIIFAPIHSPRATPMRDLLAAAEAIGVPARAAGTVEEALVWAESSPIVSDDIARPPSTVGEADAYSEGVGGLNPGTSSSFGSGHGFSRVATAVIKKEGALAPARTGTRTALRVVAGSVYLVGEIRPILLDRAQAAQAQSLQAQLPQAQ